MRNDRTKGNRLPEIHEPLPQAPRLEPSQEATAECDRLRGKLEQTELTYRLLAEEVRAIEYVASADRFDRTVRVGPRVSQILGYTPEEWMADPKFRSKRLHPGDRARVLREWRRCHTTGECFTSEYRMLARDGRIVHFRDVAPSITDGDCGAPLRQGLMLDVSAQRRSEEELARFRLGIERSDEVVFITEPDGKMVYVNPAFERTYGFPADESIGETPRILKSGLLPQETYEHFWQTLLAKEVVTGELVNRTKDGRIIHVEGSANPITDQSGEIIGFLAIQRDISDRKRAEQALRESEARFRRLADNSPEMIFRYEFGPDRRIGYVSPASLQIVGYAPAEFYEDPDLPWKLVAPEDLPALRAASAEHVDGRPITFRALHKDGHKVWLEQMNVYVRDDAGEPVAVEGILRDVTERKRAEDALRQSEERFRAIFETAAIGIELVGTDLRILDANAALQWMIGYNHQELLELTVDEYTYPEDRAVNRELYEQLLTGKCESFQMEKRYLTKDGKPVAGRLSVSLVRGAEHEPRFAVGMIENISEHKRLGEQLLRAQKLETAGRVAGQVAHDFNNLLGPLALYPDLIRLQLPQDHPAIRYCQVMLDAVQQMADINADMLALARRGHANKEETDLNQLVRQAAGQVAPPPLGLSVVLDLAPGLCPVLGTPAQIYRAITNLIANAREAMDDEGTICVKTENVYVDSPFGGHDRIQIGQYVRLSVSDTGPGIPLDVMEKVFEPFFTTKLAGTRRGSGLGLSIVQAVVEDHQGYIDLETGEGKGTTFSVYLPATEQTLEPEEVEILQQGVEQVLVVDDDPLQREVLEAGLSRLGYKVHTVPSGEEALAYLRKNDVDLLLLDMVMPGGLDGAETYKRIKKTRPGQRAILVSGFAETDRVELARSLGAGTYLRKPLSLITLATAVREELSRQGPAGPKG